MSDTTTDTSTDSTTDTATHTASTDADTGITEATDELVEGDPGDSAYPPSQPIHEGGHGHKEPTDRQYILIAVILAVLTAFEIAATEVDSFPSQLLIPFLLILMTIKFFMVILFFMHLRFDSRLFSLMFYIGLGFAVVLYGAVLATFHFFTG